MTKTEDNMVDTNKRHGERSSPYPSNNLETAIQDAEVLRDKLGKGPYSRDEAAKALGYKGVNGISASRIASCGYFGLLSRSGSSYSMSELAEKVLNYTSNEEKNKAVVEACRTPILYSKLLQSYSGQALPQMLPNILSRNYGISSKAAEAAAKIFRESADFAGYLKNGIILADPETGNSVESMVEEQPPQNETEDPGRMTSIHKDHEKERGVFESGSGWELQASCKYSVSLPRNVRKKINQFLEMADDIIDELSELTAISSQEDSNKYEQV